MTAEELIKDHEGYRPYVYLDTKNIPTGGYGHAFLHKSRLPAHIWEQIFIEDMTNAYKDYEKLGLKLDDVRRSAVLDLLFARGLPNMMKWEDVLIMLKKSNWEEAAKLIESKQWYQNVGRRGPRICALIRTGQWEALS